MTIRFNKSGSLKKISLLLSLLVATQCVYAMKVTVPKKVTAPKKTTTHLISPTLSEDVALMIKKLVKEQTSSKKIAAAPVTVTKKPAVSIPHAAVKAAVAAKSAKALPKTALTPKATK